MGPKPKLSLGHDSGLGEKSQNLEHHFTNSGPNGLLSIYVLNMVHLYLDQAVDNYVRGDDYVQYFHTFLQVTDDVRH